MKDNTTRGKIHFFNKKKELVNRFYLIQRTNVYLTRRQKRCEQDNMQSCVPDLFKVVCLIIYGASNYTGRTSISKNPTRIKKIFKVKKQKKKLKKK